MLLINQTIKVEILGKEFILSQRFARDVNKLIAFSKLKIEKEFTDILIESAITAEDGLKLNYINLPWYKFWLKRKLKKLLSKENLLEILTSTQILELAKKVFELEGILPEDEKKTPIQNSPENESAE